MIGSNYRVSESKSAALPLGESPTGSFTWARTTDLVINSHLLYLLSYERMFGSVSQIRTDGFTDLQSVALDHSAITL